MKKQLIHLALIIAATVMMGACGATQNTPAQQQAAVAADSGVVEMPVNIDAQQLEQIRNRDDVVVLDVREDWEYAEGHIPGAVLIPLGQIPDRLNEIPADKTVVAVCRSGNRSNQATQFLRQEGFDNIHNMTGGMNSWVQSGFQVAR